MRILLSYPGHMFSTYDVAAGYEKALKALGHELRVFDYHLRIDLWAGMLTLRDEKLEGKAKRFKPLATPPNISILASEGLILEAVDFVPDVVLIINGMQLHRKAYDLLKRLSLPVVLILTESPYCDVDQGVIVKKGWVKAALTNDRNSVKPLEETGAVIRYLPHSYDPEIHKPRPQLRGKQFDSDLFFHGTMYPERVEMLSPLEELIDDYEIEVGGVDPNWTDAPDFDDIWTNQDLAYHYAATKIALNMHRTIIGTNGDGLQRIGLQHIETGQAYSLGPRAYEIAACGAFQLSDDTRPELHDVFGDTVATYHDAQDLIDKVKYYLANEGEREQMAAAALERVKPCSFENRAVEILIPTIEEVF